MHVFALLFFFHLCLFYLIQQTARTTHLRNLCIRETDNWIWCNHFKKMKLVLFKDFTIVIVIYTHLWLWEIKFFLHQFQPIYVYLNCVYCIKCSILKLKFYWLGVTWKMSSFPLDSKSANRSSWTLAQDAFVVEFLVEQHNLRSVEKSCRWIK